MKTPKINNINKPILLRPKKGYVFQNIPVYFFPDNNTSITGVEFLFEIDSSILNKNSALSLSSVNSYLTCGTNKMTEFEINKKIDSFGAYISKNYNRRHFELSLHTLSNTISSVLPVMTDCIFNSIFPEEVIKNKLDNEKKSFIISSTKVTEKAKIKFKEILYGNDHVFGKKTESNDFNNLNSNILNNIHSNICCFQVEKNKNFVSNLNILISGDYPKNIIRILEDNLPKSFQINSFQKLESVDKRSSSCHYIVKDKALQTAFRIGRILPGHSHCDFFGLKVLITILGGYFGSRLMTNIREEKGYTYGIGAYLLTEKNYSELNIVTEAGSQYTKQVYSEIVKEIKNLSENSISLSELSRVKSYMLGSILHNCNGLFPQVSVFKDLKKHDSNFNFLEKLNFEINSITPSKIKYLANKYLNVDDISFVACGPKEEKIW
ncbi:MAG: insulinase family protein [Bacteroidota bacterium]|nr:insulinase family protein [Bacteroidota bacterium]